ncbi:MAG TPA: beta-L-arabinofuranosidase domain-containing protein [Ktedonobacteraceae bacterium]|nr:beta-L-arabinofuranosidase domain-containing protein [Ktedonobacteraceae bacterium]
MKTQEGSTPVVHTVVTFEDTFWAPRLRTLREQTLPFIYAQMQQDGHFSNFHEQWQPGRSPTPYVFWESDLSKWIEAASYSLATHPDPHLEALVDEGVAFLVALQQPDGYLNLWFTRFEPEKRWTNLRDWHELYCAGHLIEAAVAHFQATGKRTLLDAACRYADYIATVFGAEEGKRRGYCGHEEIELALVKLYHVTGEPRYLRLCQYFVEERGRQPHYFDIEARARGEDPAAFWARTYEYNQSHRPVREQNEVVGHAVRAMYLYSALADLARELHDDSLLRTCERLWRHLTSRRLYVTGGLGSSAANEGLTADYDLPNAAAYAETCAAIGLVLWNHRLLQLETDHRYADLLERALYNGVLSALALDGKAFFYENPLESRGDHHRSPWFRCACCPPNIARLLASLGQYVYGVNESEVMVHLYVQSTSSLSVAGQKVAFRQETRYPWEGLVRLHLEMEQPAEFALNLRIPGWCRQARLDVNGEELPIEQYVRKGYARIARRWQSGDTITLDLPMPVERVYAHPDLVEDNGRVALQRGPLVYCLEGADNDVPLHRIRLASDAELESHFEPDLLGGVAVIEGQASALETADWDDTLYRTTPPERRAHRLVAIPYYAWDQRTPGEMSVWIRQEEK